MFRFHPLSTRTRDRLLDAGVDPDEVAALVRMAVSEDLAGGIDVTSSATVPALQRSRGEFVARRAGVVAGLPVAVAVLEAVCGDAVAHEQVAADGDRVEPGSLLMRVTAPTRSLLTAERTALNLLCHLSGVATLTRRWADAIAGTGAAVRDTRKTTPGLRWLEKYAVRCGGGVNHRFALSDAALVKDNHVVAAGGISAAYRAVRDLAGATSILLDNMSVADMTAAVAIARAHPVRISLEASGGLTLERAREVAATGVDHIAVGELTHSAPVLDIGLDLQDVVD
jgi:nicotinate-nucleotide pyrophosphorylase (carboxylating)